MLSIGKDIISLTQALPSMYRKSDILFSSDLFHSVVCIESYFFFCLYFLYNFSLSEACFCTGL
jgi:hypothetical protein